MSVETTENVKTAINHCQEKATECIKNCKDIELLALIITLINKSSHLADGGLI